MRSGSIKTNDTAQLGLICIIAAIFAYANHFIQDDAFISFRYAAHFAEGKGLVWYPGSSEYGFTNFLFTLLTGLLIKTGLSAQSAAFCISVPAYFCMIVLTYHIARRLFASPLAPIFATLALATHLTFSAYATGGLETSLHACLILFTFYNLVLWEQTRKQKNLWIMSFAAALALLTRLDSALLLFPAYVWLAWKLALEVHHRRQALPSACSQFMVLAYIPTIAVACLLTFCKMTYGQALPNTFYAKIDIVSSSSWDAGYLMYYLVMQAYVPLALLLWATVCLLRHSSKEQLANMLLLASPVILWGLYIVDIGGDFMEYRLLVPILPFFYVFTTGLILDAASTPRAVIVLLLIILAGNCTQNYFLKKKTFFNTLATTTVLNDWIVGTPANWANTGKMLHSLFYTGHPDDVKIAVDAAGAIPYYSDLPAIDEWGLNTREVLKSGEWQGFGVGHTMHATVDYLRQQHVNLVLDFPIFVCRKGGRLKCTHSFASPFPIRSRALMETLPAVLIPLENQCYLMGYYLSSHPRIETLLDEGMMLSFSRSEAEAACFSEQPERPQ